MTYCFVFDRGLLTIFRWTKTVEAAKKRNATVPLLFTERAAQNPSKLMFISESRNYTYQDADHYANQIANFVTRLGLKKGDDVALFMDSSPEYVMLWLGLAKAGIVSALVNNNLKLDTLAHSIKIVNAKVVIFDREHSEAVADAIPLLKRENVKFFMVDDGDAPKGTHAIKRDLERESKSFNLIPTNFTDKLLHIYTSGTTGKAFLHFFCPCLLSSSF